MMPEFSASVRMQNAATEFSASAQLRDVTLISYFLIIASTVS